MSSRRCAPGASGFMLKNAAPEELVRAVRVVARVRHCSRRRSRDG